MLLHLTKKLADKLKLSPSVETVTDEFFSWRANYVQIDRFRLVVFMNDASRFTVVIRDSGTAKLKKLPILLSGEGDSPPEDVGGAGGFADFLEIISNPKHEEYREMSKWAVGWKRFDFERVARRVKYVNSF